MRTASTSTAASTRFDPTSSSSRPSPFAGFPDGVALERLEFEELGDGRCRLVATSLVDSFEGRDAMIASGMESGIREGYEKLDELLVP